ncbi:TPA: VanZ family protein, partial [Bacillus toyonensis]|nr:VanZ family protein [Bacillus toyonensis]
IDDVICNVLGSIVGYFIYKITLKLAATFNMQVVDKTNSKDIKCIDKS